MSEPKMTAEERIAKHTIRVAVQYCEDEEFVEPEDAVEACKAHASEAVEPWKARVAELERELAKARQERDFQQERAQVNVDLREEAKARITALEREVEEMRRAWDQTRLVLDGTCQILRDVEDEGAEMERERDEARARIAELERERDSAAALANALLLDIGQIAEALGSEASEPAALLADAQALKARVAELEDALRGLAARYHRDAHEGDGIPEDAHEWDTAQRVLLGKEAT